MAEDIWNQIFFSREYSYLNAIFKLNFDAGASRSLEEAQAHQEQIRAEIQKLQKAAEAKQAALNNHQIKLNDMKDKKNALHSELLEVCLCSKCLNPFDPYFKKLLETCLLQKKMLKWMLWILGGYYLLWEFLHFQCAK